MFFNPELYRNFTAMCVDPGLGNVGVSIWDIQTRTGLVENIEIESFQTEKIVSYSGLDPEHVGNRRYLLEKIHDRFFSLCREYRPSILIHESPFYNPSRPNAYEVLVQVLSEIRSAALRYDRDIYIESLSPQQVKKGVGAGGSKGKEIMMEKVFEIPSIMDVLNFPREDLTEHCIDSLAVGYTGLNLILSPQEGWK